MPAPETRNAEDFFHVLNAGGLALNRPRRGRCRRLNAARPAHIVTPTFAIFRPRRSRAVSEKRDCGGYDEYQGPGR